MVYRESTKPLVRRQKKGNRANSREKIIESRSINYYSGAQQSAAAAASSRDSPSYPAAPAQSSYVSAAPAAANYAPVAAYTPAGSYSSYTSYPSYSTYASAAPAYEEQFEYYDDNKTKKVALAIALPLSLVLGPLAVIGLIALFNLKAIFTIAVINALCNNTQFSTSFSNLCTIISNIGKRSSSADSSSADMIFKQIANTENVGKFVDFINSAKFTLMDRLQGPAKH